MALATGESKTTPRGPLTIRIDRLHDGVSILTMCGPTRVDGCSRTFTNDRLAAGRVWLAELHTAVDAGLHVWQIEAQMQALTAAAHAAFGTNGATA